MPEVVLWDGKGNAAKVDIPREERMLALLIECWGVIFGQKFVIDNAQADVEGAYGTEHVAWEPPIELRAKEAQWALDAIFDMAGEALLSKRYEAVNLNAHDTYEEALAPIREGLDAAEEAVKER